MICKRQERDYLLRLTILGMCFTAEKLIDRDKSRSRVKIVIEKILAGHPVFVFVYEAVKLGKEEVSLQHHRPHLQGLH